MLVRATVAEAFRDAKRGGGLKSALAGLTAEGPGGIAFVLSPSTRNVVVMALERKPSGTEKSVCMSYMLRGRGKRRQMERQRDSRQTSTSGISKVSTLYVCRASTVVKQPRGVGGEIRRVNKLRPPNLYTATKYKQTSRPRWGHAFFVPWAS